MTARGEAQLPDRMRAVLLTGHGDLDRLDVREDVPLPVVGRDDVLIRVAAAGVNNTDVNTRLGWYSKTITTGTEEAAAQLVTDRDSLQNPFYSGE